MVIEELIVGTAKDIEAEYGFENLYGLPYTVVQITNGEPLIVEGFASLEAAKRSWGWGAQYEDGVKRSYVSL